MPHLMSGGIKVRLRWVKAATQQPPLEMGQTIGTYLHQYGFNLDFAPVADVNSNPNNPIIGNRAFSSDSDAAAKMAKAMAEGLKKQQVIPTFKHFPGTVIPQRTAITELR